MNEFNILWIDDDWADINSAYYHGLNDVATDIIANARTEISIKRIFNIGEALKIIARINSPFFSKSESYDLIILDLVYNNTNSTIYADIINQIKEKNIKFIVYTNDPGSFEIDVIQKKCSQNFIDIYEKGNGNKHRFINDVIQLSSFSPITFVHLSDFHYDASLEGKFLKNQNEIFENLREFLVEAHKHRPIDFYLFSGDYAANHPDKDYEYPALFFRALLTDTVKNMDKLLFVPGNHDAYWDDFQKNKKSDKPGKWVENFYKRVFENNKEFISSLSGYTNMGELNTTTLDCFCFHKLYRIGQIKVLGLNSVQLDSRGQGYISDSVIDYIKDKWKGNSSEDELRIAFCHHNVLPPFSINNLDENIGIQNSGTVIELLSGLGCDLLLNGHSHFSGIYNFSFTSLTVDGFSTMRTLTTISAGTVGGFSPQKDRPRNFNIIQIFPTVDKNKKQLVVTPVIFDSVSKKWIERNSICSEIIQNHKL